MTYSKERATSRGTQPVAGLTAAELTLGTGGAASDAAGSVTSAGQMADARHVRCVSLSTGLSPRSGAAR
jgi:hypothetical protein